MLVFVCCVYSLILWYFIVVVIIMRLIASILYTEWKREKKVKIINFIIYESVYYKFYDDSSFVDCINEFYTNCDMLVRKWWLCDFIIQEFIRSNFIALDNFGAGENLLKLKGRYSMIKPLMWILMFDSFSIRTISLEKVKSTL